MSNVRRDPDSSPRKSDAYASSSSSSSVVRPVMSGSSLSMAASIAARCKKIAGQQNESDSNDNAEKELNHGLMTRR